MADIKRLHYFNHQFLRAKDFTDEQNYHLDMRRRHNRLLHTWGIAEGLTVEFDTGASEVMVRRGAAIDDQGREIVLTEARPVALAGFAADADVYITIAYHEQQTDPTAETGVEGNTRWTEAPLIEPSESAPSNPSIGLILARVKREGTEVKDIDETERRTAGVVAGDLLARSVTLNTPGVDPSLQPSMRGSGDTKRVELDGGLQVSGSVDMEGNLNVTGTVDGRDISADGAKLDAHTAHTDNPHEVTAVQVGAVTSVDGVSNPGGDIDLVSANAITINPNDDANRITIGENHSGRTNNPHGVTAAQVGALPIEGGTVDGNLGIKGQLSLRYDESIRAGAQFLKDNGGSALRALVDRPSSFSFRNAAVVAISFQDNVHGVYARAPNSTHSLYVQGTARVTGGVDPYLIDTAINASGQVLRTGDVVRLKGSPVSRFRGDNNKMPVAEVTLVDKENDTAVIGIVDREAIPDSDEPDHRTDRQDPTSIPDGGELFMVTLGSYAHCKVDATEAPIEVGDLLTSSSNLGHAKKATEPKIGAIIGKALEPLEEGTGYIAVFVNIQ